LYQPISSYTYNKSGGNKIKGYTQELDKVLTHLIGLSEFPAWDEEKERWNATGMRAMKVYVENLDGNKLPIKWAWIKIFGQFGISQQDLSSSQIELFFKDIGFNTGSHGRNK